MRKQLLIWIATILLVVLFAYTGISKLADYQKFVRMLDNSPYVHANPYLLGWLLPLVELATAILLVIPSTRFYGLYGSFILMLIFTAYIAFMMAFSPHLSCSCGGVIQNLGWKNHLYLNIFFTILSLIALVFQKQQLIKRKSQIQQHFSAETGNSRIPV